jgi:hypothetical protein
MDFGLKASDTNVNDAGSWRELSNAGGAISMTTYYDHKPNPDQYSTISPGGACQSASAAKTIVGNDDFTLSTKPSDPDYNNTINPNSGPLTVTFVVTNQGSATPLVTKSESATSDKSISFAIPRSQIQGWHSDGASTAYAYSWYTYATDTTGLDNTSYTGLGSKSQPCLFTYDPTAPQAPGLAPPAAIDTEGDIGTLGGTATFELGNCTTIVDSGTACSGNAPSSYVYQVDDGPEQTIAVTGTTQNLTIPLTRYGTNTISVTAESAAGNMSSPTPAQFDVDEPTTAYADGDYAGTRHPDLITVGDSTGSSKNPGLWLAESNGAGTLSTPIDIGVRGTGMSTNGSPADWAGAQVLHGNFTGNNVQDIVAYYPGYTSNQTGFLFMIGGPGAAASLDPESGNTWYVPGTGPVSYPGTADAQPTNPAAVGWQNPLDDTKLDTTGYDTPVDLVAAGNASLTSNPLPDLIGIVGDTTVGYELNIYTAGAGSFSTAYAAAAITASTTATSLTNASLPSTGPDGNAWGPNWTLQVAQPGGTAVLFALDRANGQLWESVNQPSNTPTTACPSATDFLVGMPCSTWTQVTGGPWTANAGPALAQADVNTAGAIELWTTSGGTATAWTLSTSTPLTLTQEVANTLRNPGHEWPLTDGPAQSSAGSSTLIDTENDADGASSSSGVAFTGNGTTGTDPVLGPTAVFANSAASSLTLPAGILQDTTSAHAALQTMTLTLKFNASPGSTGILAGTSTGSLTDSTLSSKSAPILYIGTDGHLYAQFPSAHISSNGVVAQDVAPLESAARVDDSLWHTVTLIADGVRHDQILFLDNNIPIHLWANGFEDPTTPATIINPGQTTSSQAYGLDQVTVGAGIFSAAGWVNADATHGAAGTTRVSYFTGQISDVAIYPEILTPAQLPADYPGPLTTVINSGVLSSQCIDNTGGVVSDGNPIQIYTCNAHATQNWTFSVNTNGTMAIKYAANPSYCVNVTANGTANGTLIELYGCNGTNGQYWQVLPNGSLMNQGSGKCLDDPLQSTTNGTQLQLYACNGTSAQTWASLVRPAQAARAGTIVSTATGWCLDNANGSTTSPNKIQVNTCTGNASEQWTFQANGTITVDGMCINNTGSNTNDGNTVNAQACNGTGAQVWAHQDNGDLENPQTGKCIQVSTTTLLFGLQLWTCDNDPDQTFVYSSTWNHS